MSKFLKSAGIVLIIAAVISFLSIAGLNLLTAILSSFLSLALGISLFVTANLLDRVSYLEQKLNISLESEISKDQTLPQRTCPQCSTTHDFDYPKCPNCKYNYYESEKTKK